ncbi:MAG: radical SAM protein [Calditrichaceae bacterium]
MINESKINVIEKNPLYLEYDNNTVIIIVPEKPLWLKTSTTGKWIYEQIKSSHLNINELIRLAAKNYSLPKDALKDSITNLICQLEENNFIKFSSDTSLTYKDDNNLNQVKQKKLELKNDELPKLGLINVWFNILSTCNLSCDHCFLHKEKKSKPISFEDAKFIISNLVKLKPKRLNISGGEPLLHPNLLEILQYAKDSFDWEIVLVTNGQTENEELIKSISGYLSYIQISIDGINSSTNDRIRGTGTFKRAVNIFKILHRMNSSLKKCISFTPHPENVSQIPDLFKFAISLDADLIYITKPKIPSNNNNDRFDSSEFLSLHFREKVYSQYDKLIKIYMELTKANTNSTNIKMPIVDPFFDPSLNLLNPIKRACCGAGGSILFINELGECYPCAALNRPELSLGNLFNTSLEEIYYNNSIADFRQSIHVDNIDECQECCFKYICAGDCRALSYEIKDKTPYCELIKQRYHKLLKNVYLPKQL